MSEFGQEQTPINSTKGQGARMLKMGVEHGRHPTVAFPVADGLVMIAMEHIVRLEADGGYTWIHKADGAKQLVSRRLGDLHCGLSVVLPKNWTVS